MLAVAIGWQLYALSGRALDLGLVGLVMGGLGTIAVAALWARLFPELRHASTLDR